MALLSQSLQAGNNSLSTSHHPLVVRQPSSGRSVLAGSGTVIRSPPELQHLQGSMHVHTPVYFITL